MASRAQRMHASLASPLERALAIGTATVTVAAPTTSWTLPVALIAATLVGGCYDYWQRRRDGAHPADATAAEATVPCAPIRLAATLRCVSDALR